MTSLSAPASHPPLELRLDQVPFSVAGSYLALSTLAATQEIEAGLWLRTVRGASGHRELARIEVGSGSANGPLSARFESDRLRLSDHAGAAEISFATPHHIVLTATRGPLSISFPSLSGYDVVVETAHGAEWQILRLSGQTTLTATTEDDVVATHDWDGVTSKAFALHIPEGASLNLHDLHAEPAAAVASQHASALPGFADFLAGMPAVPPVLADTRTLAAYVMWSAIVQPSGHLRRPSMYMSKNWMCGVWSWDHCFNALALGGHPELARHQFLTVFDNQLPSGRLPDITTDAGSSYVFVKPPIHGWALKRLIESGVADESFLRDVYPLLAAWTNWWLTERVMPGRRLPHYFHGNDSGWDNGTIFAAQLPLETPELAALLVIQLDTLSTMAAMLGAADEAAQWRSRGDDLLTALGEELWVGDRFVARSSATGAVAETPTLMLFLPLMLGDRLPGDVRDALLRRIRSSGLITGHGVATESVGSGGYEDDGYWRGPIWAPTTLMIVEGLRACGDKDLAALIAERFSRCVAEAGMAENFDARTGAGLRDRAYSWTASVFLLLASTSANTDQP